MISVKEFAANQAVKQLVPIVSHMFDKDIGRLITVAHKLAPTEFTRSVLESADKMWREQSPNMEVIKRIVRQSNSHCLSQLVADFGVKHHWFGDKRREEMYSKEGIVVPFTYLISPTMRCNLRCVGCYAGEYSMKDDLEYEVIDRILTEGKELGVYLVVIVGGEPFIRQDMWDIYQKHSDIFFIVFTNGTLIDEEAANHLRELGNVAPMLSIEGYEEETDGRRGKGVFHKVLQAMDNLREEGVVFGFSSMITRKNVNTIISDEFNDMLIEKGCAMGWHFLYIPVGRNPDVSLMPTVEQRELLRNRGAFYIRTNKPLFVIDFWNDAPYVGGCIAGGRHFFHINSHGDAEPCIFVHFAADNVKQKSLREILTSPYFNAIKSRQPYSDNLLRPCMIIDHPHVLRDIYAEILPYTTCPESESLVTTLCGSLDSYASEAAQVLDASWENDPAPRALASNWFWRHSYPHKYRE